MIILYKKDTKDKIRILKIYTDGPDLVQVSGLMNSEKLVEHRKTCKAKNIGKINVTTPEIQAISEMNSKITDKLTQGYCISLEELENNITILPMLAEDYPKYFDKINWARLDTYAQTKCDGQRCLAHINNGVVTLMSRDGKEINNLLHIVNSLSKVKENIILDGELYAHGYSFNQNMKMIKKYRPGETEKIVFHIYDTVSDLPYSQRKEIIENYKYLKSVEIVKSYQVLDEIGLMKKHKDFLSEGYEGTIIRHGDSGYKKNGRSNSLLKLKDFDDIALVITNIIPAEQRPEWGVPQFYWKGANNDTLEAGTKMSHEERIDLLKNKDKYIGKTAELRFFGYSDKGVPRQPIMEGFRNDK